MSRQLPNELVEHFANGQGTIFVGAGFSFMAGLPDKDALKRKLASELDGYPKDSTYEDITRYYENQFGRRQLISRLMDSLNTASKEGPALHKMLIQLPINRIFTTNYDDLLEKAARAVKRKYSRIVNESDIHLASTDLQIIKLYGDISIPASIVTANDLDLYPLKHSAFTSLLSLALKTSTMLFLGFSPKDTNIQQLLAQSRDEGGLFSRNFYSIQFGMPALVVDDLARRGLKVINLDAQTGAEEQSRALIEWLQALNDGIAQHEVNRPATPVVPVLRDLEISAEVKAFLQTMEFTVVKETWQDSNPIFQVRRMMAGEDITRWFLCQESPVTNEDYERLHALMRVDQTSKGWIITRFSYEDDNGDDTRELAEKYPTISVHTLSDFYRQMLRYDAYLEELIREAAELEKYWVDLECGLNNRLRRFNIIRYVDAWINSGARNHLALLGDFGTGKTWFCRYYAARLARKHLQNPEYHRIPILISLQGYAKALKIEDLVTEPLRHAHVDLLGGFETFMHLNRHGRLLLIFDGFDEMERRIDDSLAQRNYEDIRRTAVENSKVIITSRPIFFKDKEYLSVLLKSKGEQPTFEMLTTLILEDYQIQEMLRKLQPDGTQWEEHWRQINSIKRLRDIASRPVMVQIISQTLPAVLHEGESRINGAGLYRRYIDEWIEKAYKKDEPLLTRREEVLAFLHDVAWDMYCTQGTGTIIPSQFYEAAGERFGQSAIVAELADLFVRDKTTGNYLFPHISFMEFFVADKVMKNLCNGNVETLFACSFVKESSGVIEFLIDLASSVEAQTGLLHALLIAQSGEQTELVIKLLTEVGENKPIKLIMHILAQLDQQQGKSSGHGAMAGSVQNQQFEKIIQLLKHGLSEHVVQALGKEKFLRGILPPSPKSPRCVRYFFFDLLGSSAVTSGRALKVLARAMYEDTDMEVRLRAVQALGKRRGEKEVQTLIEAIRSKEVPRQIRKDCIEKLLASSFPGSPIHSRVLEMMHEVINNNQDDIRFREDCVIRLAQCNSQEALEPLLPILKEFSQPSEHPLWMVLSTALYSTSVLNIASKIEQEVILPKQAGKDLIRQIAYLRGAVDAIKANAEPG